MNRILHTLVPRCEASTRMLLSSFGTSGLLHVLAGAVLATWLGSMAPHLFPPRQGFNSIQATASHVIVVETVDAQSEAFETIVIETAGPSGGIEPADTGLHREPIARVPTASVPPALIRLACLEASTSLSTMSAGATRRTQPEPTPGDAHERPVLPRTELAEPLLPTQTSVASLASRQDAGQLDAIPTQIFSPQPEYPAQALRQRFEGRVVLRVTIDPSGRVTATSVLRSSGHSMLDDAARQAVLQWRFDPPKRLGIAVQTEIAVPIRFQIEDF